VCVCVCRIHFAWPLLATWPAAASQLHQMASTFDICIIMGTQDIDHARTHARTHTHTRMHACTHVCTARNALTRVSVCARCVVLQDLDPGWHHCTSEGNIKGAAANTGNFASYKNDADDVAALGFDGVKFDAGGGNDDMNRWAVAINATGREMLLENCNNGGCVHFASFFDTGGRLLSTTTLFTHSLTILHVITLFTFTRIGSLQSYHSLHPLSTRTDCLSLASLSSLTLHSH
jgi:hypothetical protein